MSQLVDFITFIGAVETLLLLIFAARFYLFTYVALKFGASTITSNETSFHNLAHSRYDFDEPFISVLLAVYNEKNVINRLLDFCTNFDYPSYEVIVIDDSTDETTELLAKWKDHPRVKIIHRSSRKGWKGGALNVGIDKLDPRSMYSLVLDADFVPPSDLLQRFIERFNNDKVTVVQGYQVHDLNAEENWITKGYRVMFSVSNMIELIARNKLKLLLPITGSVYMIRTDVLKKMRFNECLTEDWDLTLRLYEAGYKVVYDPTLRASAECPDTLSKYFVQNMRWAEGHTRSAFRQHFWKMLKSEFLTRREKVDFFFHAGIYLNSILILASSIGGILVLLSSPITLILTINYVSMALMFVAIGFPSLIIASIVALSSENQKGDFGKIPNLLILGYISTPVVAYAALKGLLSDKIFFHRTYKTGKVTKRALLSELKKLFRR